MSIRYTFCSLVIKNITRYVETITSDEIKDNKRLSEKPLSQPSGERGFSDSL